LARTGFAAPAFAASADHEDRANNGDHQDQRRNGKHRQLAAQQS
jgi:hypothetical protein